MTDLSFTGTDPSFLRILAFPLVCCLSRALSVYISIHFMDASFSVSPPPHIVKIQSKPNSVRVVSCNCEGNSRLGVSFGLSKALGF